MYLRTYLISMEYYRIMVLKSEILSPHQALRESLRSGLGDESRSGQGVAVKIIPDADNDLTSLSEEIKFLQDLRSPFVVSFIESLLFDNELWLVVLFSFIHILILFYFINIYICVRYTQNFAYMYINRHLRSYLDVYKDIHTDDPSHL